MTYNVQFPGLGIDMAVNTDAFSIGDFTIKWYGVIIAVGFLLAFLYALASCKKMNINQDRLLDVVIVGIIVGIVGARLYYVAFYPGDKYINDPVSILYVWEGGLAIYGGIIGGLLGGALMAKIRRVKIPAVLDIASLGFLIGQAIGRWGNFVNQEAFGTKTTVPWRMYSENTEALVGGAAHPCFFYESVWCILGFLLLHLFTRKWRRYDGQTFLLYLIWYGTGRFFIEGMRTDSLIVFADIRVSQLVAAVTVVAGIVLLFVFRKRTSLLGCGNPVVMELNRVSDEIPEDEINGAEIEPEFGTIFGDLGYEDVEESADKDLSEEREAETADEAEAKKTEAEAEKELDDALGEDSGEESDGSDA